MSGLTASETTGVFTPPSLKGSLILPGNIGGMHWGGAAWDRDHDLLIVPSNNLAALIRLIPRESFTEERKGNRIGAENYSADRYAVRDVASSVKGTERTAMHTAAMGDARRDRTEHRRPEMASSLRRDARGARFPEEHRHTEPRRPDRHRRRADLRRRLS